MLLQLRIENLATIRELEVEFKNGFSILTGETGAGKSIMIDAILIVLGHRVDTDIIRTGEENAVVEAIFSLPKSLSEGRELNLKSFLEDSGISVNEELIIRCLLSRKGRQKRNINGVSVTVDFLKKVGQQLINIHGQHDNQSLLQVTSHLDFLDGYGKLIPLRQKVSELYHALQVAIEEQATFNKQYEERSKLERDLKEIINELSGLNLKPGEENDLRREEKKLTNVEKLSAVLGNAHYQLQEMDTSIIEQLELLRNQLSEVERIDSECEKFRAGIETALFQSEDIDRELLKYVSKIEEDPERLSWINQRLSQIQHLVRKFNLDNAEDLINFFEESKFELKTLEIKGENEQEIIEKIDSLEKQLKKFAKLLSEKRRQIASIMDQNIVKELQLLGMEKAQFKTQINSMPFIEDKDSCSSKGIDDVKFLLNVNPGQEMRSLAKIASGGELSRIMLAIKTVLTSMDMVEILIFDEIDTGISGAVAQIVGQKLHSLGKRHQTICITHLPQIAAFADHHLLVSKHQKDEETFTKIKSLETKNDRILALADLIGGKKITEQTIELANEMINNFNS